MARPRSQTPSLRYHLSGQSVVTLDGRDFISANMVLLSHSLATPSLSPNTNKTIYRSIPNSIRLRFIDALQP
jgi:hypothetical protein